MGQRVYTDFDHELPLEIFLPVLGIIGIVAVLVVGLIVYLVVRLSRARGRQQ